MHLSDVVVAVVLEGHGDRLHQHMAQDNEIAYHELLDSAGHDQDGKAYQPELPPQYQQLPPHEGRLVVTDHAQRGAPACEWGKSLFGAVSCAASLV